MWLLIVQTKYILIQSHVRLSLLGQHDVSSSQGLRSRCLDTMENMIRQKYLVEYWTIECLWSKDKEYGGTVSWKAMTEKDF